MADVMFERLQFLVETILHLTEMSMRDYRSNITREDDEKQSHLKSPASPTKPNSRGIPIENGSIRTRKRKASRNAVKSGVNEMEQAMKGKVFDQRQRAKLRSDFKTS